MATRGVQRELNQLLAAIIIPVISACLAAAYLGWDAYRKSALAANRSIAVTVAAGLDRELLAARTLVETLSLIPVLRERDYSRLRSVVKEALASRPGAWVVLFDRDGKRLFHSLDDSPSGSVFDASTLTVPYPGVAVGSPNSVAQAITTGKTAYSDVFWSRFANALSIAIDVPVRAGTDELNFVLSIGLPLSLLRSIAAHPDLPPETGVSLVDRTGRVMARRREPERYVGMQTSEMIRKAVREGRSTWTSGRTLDGRDVLAALAASSESGYMAVVSSPNHGFVGFVWHTFAYWFAALLLLAIYLAYVIRRYGRSFARPLDSLVTQARDPDKQHALLHSGMRNSTICHAH